MLKALQSETNVSHPTVQKETSSANINSKDSKVDTSDIPELTNEDWAKSKKNLFYRPNAILSRNKS